MTKGRVDMDSPRSIGKELRMVSNMMRRKIHNSETARELENVTGMHGWALAFLCDHRDRDVFQRDIESEFRLRRSSATNLLQLMEKNGLITRTAVDYDARLKKINVTEKALALHGRFAAEAHSIEDKLSYGITEAEMETFFAVMDKIKNNIERGENDGLHG